MQKSSFYDVKQVTGILLAILIMNSLDMAIAFNDPPPRCQGAGDLQSISLTDWESGLGSWTVGRHDIAVPDDFTTPDWAVIGSLPDDRPGNAAFVENADDFLLCELEEVDQTGALTLDSPGIVIPAGTLVPRVSVDHWFAIEVNWDGGNFKISVNGGDFELIPAEAIEFGSYNLTIYPSVLEDGTEWNTNPLAGQEGFSGPEFSWGQSHINLEGIAQAGDTVRLRFDFGLDECYGDIGWYVDDVEIYSCSDEDQREETQLTLEKQVVNNNGGTAQASAWTLAADGPGAFSGSGPSVTSGAGLAPGTYNLSESGPAGYEAGNWACDGGTQVDGDTITIASDQVVTCTITNDDIQPTLTVVKTVINDNGGSISDPDAFGLRINGNSVSDSVSNALNAGNYTVSEDGLPGYVASAWGGDCNSDGTISLEIGENAACTITNNDIQPTLTIVKTIVNDNGGTITDPNAFGLRINGNSVSDGVSNAVNAGNHTVSEDGLDGYKAGVWAGDCNSNGTITLAVGQNATCTITNNDIAPTLKVFKTIINDNGGKVEDPNAFGLRVDGDIVSHNVSNTFDAGDHEVTEDGLPEYKAGSWGGDCLSNGTVSLVLGQTATCTITNDDIDPNDMIFRDGFE